MVKKYVLNQRNVAKESSLRPADAVNSTTPQKLIMILVVCVSDSCYQFLVFENYVVFLPTL